MQTGKARWTDYNIAYHFIWIPKYRCRILTGEVQAETKRLIAGCCERHGITRFRKGDALCFCRKTEWERRSMLSGGIPKGHDKLVVLVTAYRPDPARWDETFTQRRK